MRFACCMLFSSLREDRRPLNHGVRKKDGVGCRKLLDLGLRTVSDMSLDHFRLISIKKSTKIKAGTRSGGGNRAKRGPEGLQTATNGAKRVSRCAQAPPSCPKTPSRSFQEGSRRVQGTPTWPSDGRNGFPKLPKSSPGSCPNGSGRACRMHPPNFQRFFMISHRFSSNFQAGQCGRPPASFTKI